LPKQEIKMGRHISPQDQIQQAVRKALGTLTLLCGLAGCFAFPATASAGEPALALSRFFLLDSSGEQRDQRAEHAARLQHMDEIVQDELARSGRFALVEMTCPSQRCTGQEMKLDELLGRAEAAGAGFLAVGAVEKMSTLVLWSRLEVYDVGSRKLVFNRLFTFRGDNDEAWRRAALYMARDLIRNAPQ
jgi:hypothetical protein